ncbi:MAG: glycosyltransferase [Candidatus Daviesbacteria bacterium]|nr:glycosyltransferase [Candidatus Daviesbacteria bacterium]
MKVALAHDYLREYGGAERVLETIHEMFPDAPVYTAYYNPESLGVNAKRFASWNIKTSWMQKVPFANKLISPFRIFAPFMFETFDFSEYDLVISSSSAVYFAKAVLTKPHTLHLSYIHTPPRFLYGYTTSFNYKKNPITHILGEIVNHILRIYDFNVSQRPDILMANSKNVQARIKKFYRRDSVIIYPPVNLKEFVIPAKAGIYGSLVKPGMTNSRMTDKEYFLSLNRLVRGKGTEIAVEACTKLNLPLKVVGMGPELVPLRSVAQNYVGCKNIEFLGNVSDEERVKLYAGAKALIVASEDEDFGITPVEAQAAGTPVIALKAGGFLETVVAGKTGEFFSEPNAENLMEVLKDFDPQKYNPEDCRKQAEKFSEERFKKELLDLIEKNIKK